MHAISIALSSGVAFLQNQHKHTDGENRQHHPFQLVGGNEPEQAQVLRFGFVPAMRAAHIRAPSGQPVLTHPLPIGDQGFAGRELGTAAGQISGVFMMGGR